MIIFQSLTQENLAELLVPLSHKRPGELNEAQALKRARYRAKQIFNWVYQRLITDWEEMSDLSKPLRSWLKENIQIYRLQERKNQLAQDGTYKILWDLIDHKTVESVVIPVFDQNVEATNSKTLSRLTLCISSQVGCAMGCKFCLTGIQGLDRHLEVHEIVTQVFELRKHSPLTNIVFMGMGEPLHNLKNVIQACKILIEPNGLNFSKRKVTVSTSGIVPAIEELGKSIDVSLAISLNATTDTQRSQIMPVNKKWNIEALLKTLRAYPLGSHRSITFEYVLLKDFNDSLEDAARLVGLMKGLRCKINLIPFNEHSGSEFKRPTEASVIEFRRYLLKRGLIATIRHSRGRDILAACGQLRSLFGTARGSERHRDYNEKFKTDIAL
jgi:23S rRNA (adenine2503-C2)-methyltransferase